MGVPRRSQGSVAALVLVLCAACSAMPGGGSPSGTPRSPVPHAAVREETVQFPGTGVTLKGELFVPEARNRKDAGGPAVVLLHGCGGLYTSRGQLTSRHRDWALRFASWGFVVLMPDSFGSRGVGPICELKDRPTRPWRERTLDTYAALHYLLSRPDVDPRNVFVMGWSDGGSTVMGVVAADAPGRHAAEPSFKAAIAYYPGCARPLRQKVYRPTMPLLIQHGAADDWVPPAPCVELATKLKQRGTPIEIIIYPEAHHGFDAPNTPVRLLPNVYNPRALGQRGAHIGTNEPARLKAIADTKQFVDLQLAH